jgi:hypothetical protein
MNIGAKISVTKTDILTNANHVQSQISYIENG